MLACWILFHAVGCERDAPQRAPAGAPSPRVAAAAPTAAVDQPDAATSARVLLERFECNRCHEGTGLGPAPADRDCVACHREIREGRFAAPPAELAGWRARVHSLLVTPSLQASGARLRRAWIADFLRDPHDVRPHLPATMPRLALGAADAAVIAAHLVQHEQLELEPGGDANAGAALYLELRCARCHRFGGAALPAAHAGPAELGVPARQLGADEIALAPDLALARDRMQPGRLVAWLRDPGALAPGTLMPSHGLNEQQARDLSVFLISAPLRPAAPRALPPRLPPLARAVGWDEVDARVFAKVCRHCHAAPHFARGDGGPGNTGGFGFPARGLDLSSYEGIASGSLDDAGEPRSVFGPLPDGTPRLLAHLLARTSEEAGTAVDGVRGMPLGLPALSPRQLQLVETWIAQGRPR